MLRCMTFHSICFFLLFLLSFEFDDEMAIIFPICEWLSFGSTHTQTHTHTHKIHNTLCGKFCYAFGSGDAVLCE